MIMAADAASLPLTNGSSPAAKPIQLAISLPNAAGARIHVHLTILATTILLFVTTAGADTASNVAALGSFVYAMPDRYNPTQPISTILYSYPASLDFATRLAKVLARRTGKAVHVGSSVSFASSAEGGTVEEEMEGFKRVVEVVMGQIDQAKTSGSG